MAAIAGVRTITPASPEFASAIQSVVDPAVLSDVQAILPFCYVLINNSEKIIIVYSTRWALTDGSGLVITHDSTWWNLSSLRGGDAIAAGTSRLVSPIFRLGMRRVGPSGSLLAQEVQRRLAAFATKAKVDVSLETVIFEDGAAFGRDATNASAQAQANLDAERQISDLISQTAATGDDVAQLLARLAAAAPGPMSNPPGYEDTLGRKRQFLSSFLLNQLQSISPVIPNRVEIFQKSVAAKRSLNIIVR